MVLYLITICKAQKLDYVDESELRSVMSYLFEHKHYFKDYTFERHGKYRQLHCHAIVDTQPIYKTFKVIPFRVYYSPVYDIKGAMNYLHKDAYNRYRQEQILAENQYQIYRFLGHAA